MRHIAGAMAFIGMAGCLVVPADFSREKKDLERATGLTLRPTNSMNVGPGTLALARGWSKSGGDEVLRHLDRVELETFSVKGGSAARAVAAFRAGPDWAPVARVREKGSSARIFLDEGSGNSGRLLVVTSEGQELTFVRIEGRLDALLEESFDGSWTRREGAKHAAAESD
jgi:hypothetical protein